jgi:hypothetical protein
MKWVAGYMEKIIYGLVSEARGSVVVKALCCKPEGRGFKSR